MQSITELRYGADSKLRFDRELETQFVECHTSQSPLVDLAAVVEEALAQPVDFPAFKHAVVPGDKVVLAFEQDVPQVETLVAGILRSLAQSGVAPNDVTVLRPKTAASHDRESTSRGIKADEPQSAVHDPSDRGHLAYLAATREGEPVYMNRLLCDADVILPIGCARLEPGNGVRLDGGLYPAFSDAKAQQRLQGVDAAGLKKRHEDLPDVGWMLGIQCAVQVVPGPGDSVLRVLAGEPSAVTREGQKLCQQAWNFSVPRRASLVVAAIEGSTSQQTWSHVARAVAAAADAVVEDGAIAVCCDLDVEPSLAVQTLGQSEDRQAALRRIRKQHLPDLEVATRLARAMDRAKVYLLSQLDESVVEDLGIAPVTSPADLVRLARRHRSCILLANAQHAVARPAVDE